MKSLKPQNIRYLTVNDSDELWGVYATTIGSQSIAPRSNYPPKHHPSAYWFNPNSGRILQEFIILYVTKGEGVFESSSCKPVKISAGTIVLLFPGEWHTYKPATLQGWDEYWIGLNGETLGRLIKGNFFSKKKPVYEVGFNEQFVALFNQGIEVAHRQNTAYQQVLAGIANLLLGLVFYAEKNNSFRDKNVVSQINRAKMIMMENADRKMDPACIAEAVNLSYPWFRKLFKQYTGFSPAQYQLEIKVQKAKEFLTISNLQIKEIAFNLDFESVSYFVRFFKSRTGMSPLAYRNRMKGRSTS